MIDLSTACGGVPFLSATFRPRHLLAAVAAKRAYDIERGGGGLPAKLSIVDLPRRLERVGANGAKSSELKFSRFDRECLERIHGSIGRLRAIHLQWTELLLLPVSFGQIDRGDVISCSSPDYPQHIFLSKAAFRTPAELDEQMLHEFCHNWMYLVEEVWPLQGACSAGIYRLPTGTVRRCATEVVGAAHVAATLIKKYELSVAACDERRQWLLNYLRECVQLMGTLRPCALSPAGWLVADVIRNSWEGALWSDA